MISFPGKTKYDAQDYRRLVEILRGEGGCPWDRAQTHATLRRFLLEESSELCEAIDEDDPDHLREELGDVWLQILLHADIEREAGRFDLDDVADTACRKMIRRHPHVFGGDTSASWEDIKREEKHQETTAQAMNSVCRTLPALWRAEKLLKKAAAAGLEPEDAEAPTATEEELGRALFELVRTARQSGIDPEQALHKACEAYIRQAEAREEKSSAVQQK